MMELMYAVGEGKGGGIVKGRRKKKWRKLKNKADKGTNGRKKETKEEKNPFPLPPLFFFFFALLSSSTRQAWEMPTRR